MPYSSPVITEQRSMGLLTMLRLDAPELAQAVRPGQVVLVRCAPATSADPVLRRALFVAGTDPAMVSLSLLIDPDEPGLAWLATQPVGTQLDVYGPVGNGFTLDGRTQRLLLVGTGSALASLIFLATQAVVRNHEVVLLAAASDPARLPPPYVLPSDVEYQTSDQGAAGLIALLAAQPRTPVPALSTNPIAWTDQLALALDPPLVGPLVEAVRAGRMRWERGFAQVALAGALPCGLGLCQACLYETRDGSRLRCKDGPVFDLRDLR
ncbi:MAG: hypothetical protein AB4911_07395 [Oscillochloridaceae bacterium umkhey_bin13]